MASTVFTEVITWIDADGVEWVMDHTNDVVPLVGKRGRFLPPVELTADPVVGLPGTVVRNVRFQDREIALPVGFVGSTHLLMNLSLRDWQYRLNPTRGPGRLVVERTWMTGMLVTTSTRSIPCYYAGGLEGAEGEEDTAGRVLKAVLVFRATEPFWEELPYEFTGWPLTGLSSDFTTATPREVVNIGDVETWITWGITTSSLHGLTGPITITNATTGKSLVYSANLAVDKYLEISTKPGERTCRSRSSGGGAWTNQWGQLDPASEMWPLIPGPNMISIHITGWTSPQDFNIDSTWAYRYLGV